MLYLANGIYYSIVYVISKLSILNPMFSGGRFYFLVRPTSLRFVLSILVKMEINQ